MKKLICFLASAVFTLSAAFTVLADEKNFPFIDIARDSWYYTYIEDAYNKNIIAGTTDTIYGPGETLTRGMASSLIYRMYGSPEVSYKAIFPDVPDGEWYTDGIIWVSENGIMSGYDDGTFCPEWAITVEQFASIFYRLSGSPAVSDADKALSDYPDGYLVSGYAREAVVWAAQNNLLSGETLHPATALTRSEAAKMLSVYTTINDFHAISNLGAISEYIKEYYDSTFDMTKYKAYSGDDNDDDIYLYFMVGSYRSNFGYHAVMSGENVMRVEMMGVMNPYFLSADIKEPSLTDEDVCRMALEEFEFEYTVESQTVTKYFNMDNLKFTFEVETVYIDENGEKVMTEYIYEA